MLVYPFCIGEWLGDSMIIPGMLGTSEHLNLLHGTNSPAPPWDIKGSKPAICCSSTSPFQRHLVGGLWRLFLGWSPRLHHIGWNQNPMGEANLGQNWRRNGYWWSGLLAISCRAFCRWIWRIGSKVASHRSGTCGTKLLGMGIQRGELSSFCAWKVCNDPW